jgi:hypothetical protein
LLEARALAQNSPSAERSSRRIDAALEAVDGALEEYRKANAAFYIGRAGRQRENVPAREANGIGSARPAPVRSKMGSRSSFE